MAGTDLQTLGLAAIVFVATGFIFLYMWLRVRRQRAELAREPIPTREQLDDRAFNQIHIARASAERLQRSGVDVGDLTTLLDNAEKARARGDPDTATALARSAQEALVRLRSQAPTAVPATGGATAAPSAPAPGGYRPDALPAVGGPPSPGLGPASDTAPAEGAPGRLPKNKAESRFQLNLLEEEVRKAENAAPGSAEAIESRRILNDGLAAFDRGDYTEALRLGLRGRRRVGGRLETLAPSRATVAEPAEEGEKTAAAPPSDGPSTCASCGAPLKATDGFCRACGAPRSSARCAKCGEALAPDDRFCGACGEPIRT